MKTEIEKAEKPLVFGSRPSHNHKCGHQCNSPYCGPQCDDYDCENCGGPVPCIYEGFEPWRGRS